ncbi:MAG TPA: M20/M25/M40 family metallo-hydrolase, partial [Ottowia sp.]|nr:M20/M25/M40 family metallo-hydrolase [Ottowia sp.]
MTATRRLAEALIARPSVTPAHGGCIDLIAERLAPLGFEPHVIDSGPADWRVRNLWSKRVPAQAGRAPQAIKTMVFAGHVDVVPPGPAEAWRSPPFTPTEREGRLYGRGASDMKSSIAAFVVAV